MFKSQRKLINISLILMFGILIKPISVKAQSLYLLDQVQGSVAYSQSQSRSYTLSDILKKLLTAGTVPSRGNQNNDLPYVLNPRQTTILNDHPTFQWNEVENTDYYTVELLGDDLSYWTDSTNDTHLSYPSEKDSLKPDVYYWLTIKTNNNQSSTEENVIWFQILAPKDKEKLDSALSELDQENLSPEGYAIAKANTYGSFNLYQEAINTLTQFLQQNPESPMIHQILGVSYHIIGLVDLAHDHYLKALELAPEDAFSIRAEAQEYLGAIALSKSELEEARNWYLKALTSYQQLEDTANQNRIQTLIDKLSLF